MQLHSYLFFRGDCAPAFRFYEKCLGGSMEAMLTYGASPVCGDMPADMHDKVMHACLKVGDAMLMGSDSPPQYQEEPKGFSVSVTVEEPAEADRVFAALAANGTVRMPMEETFWARRFGMLVDQFGIPWMVNCAKPT